MIPRDDFITHMVGNSENENRENEIERNEKKKKEKKKKKNRGRDLVASFRVLKNFPRLGRNSISLMHRALQNTAFIPSFR